jgi:argininosuccinate lyase
MLPNEPSRLWSGRFRKSPDPALLRLAVHDIAGSRAHARKLARAGILTASERAGIDAALGAVAEEIASGGLVMAAGDEDVHSFRERVLIARLGPVGAKLRAGRSRNDQAAMLGLGMNQRAYIQRIVETQGV